jgi:2-polyprenyl-3-methyl-5-hydroxy-6-metoxy-1,4-benzoquinol methylase
LGQFDVGLICDVIEHIEKPIGRDLINQLLAHCQTVILTTRVSFWPQ